MNFDISMLSTVVRRTDVAATLKSFFAVLAPFLVIWNLAAIAAAATMFFGVFEDTFDDEDTLFNGAIFLVAILGAIAPLGFIAADWAARRPTSRYLSAINAAALGAIGFALIGAAIGFMTFVLEEAGEPIFSDSTTRDFLIIGVPALIALCAWLVTDSRRIRITLGMLLAIACLLVVTGIIALVPVLGQEFEEGDGEWTAIQLVSSLLAIALFSWWLVRAVRLRIFLSGGCPRSLLLGTLHRPSIWVRLAYLAGLPSSLWSVRAMGTAAFWVLIISRPLVYIGFGLLLADTEEIDGWKMATVTGIGLIIAGHFTFFAGKRLAARYMWKPEARNDTRAPILFLRSFEDDQLNFKRPYWDLVGRWFDLWSFRRNADEALIDEMAQYGPVVALGQPGEKKAPFGAMRYYATHEDWQSIITETAQRAQAIVIVAGDSPGVLWEFDLLSKEKLLDRAILLFRPGAATAEINRRALRAFPTSVDSGLAELPATAGKMIALLPSSKGPALLIAKRPTAASYVVALRAHFQKCGVDKLCEPGSSETVTPL